MEALSELSYIVHFPAFHTHYSAFISLAQLAAAVVVLSGLFSAALRQRLTMRVIGLFWALVGVNYYAMTVGGVYGSVMCALCCIQCALMLVNCERLWLDGRLSVTIDYLPLVVDMKTVNTAMGTAGAFTMLVRCI